MQQVQWYLNDDDGRYEGKAERFNVLVTVEPNIDYVVYIAAVEPADGSGPRMFAPHAFKELEEAQAWCEETVAEQTRSTSAFVEQALPG